MGPGPNWVVPVADETDLDARRQARVDAALRAGWVIRHDPVRGEFSAAVGLQNVAIDDYATVA